mmetsp:Transcript_33756/g.111178  ORF Transcript_33756/g.111178 Transcript_33756/m.111178 type:complete len:387 (-) Transcript_33756:1691-2851(-)
MMHDKTSVGSRRGQPLRPEVAARERTDRHLARACPPRLAAAPLLQTSQTCTPPPSKATESVCRDASVGACSCRSDGTPGVEILPSGSRAGRPKSSTSPRSPHAKAAATGPRGERPPHVILPGASRGSGGHDGSTAPGMERMVRMEPPLSVREKMTSSSPLQQTSKGAPPTPSPTYSRLATSASDSAWISYRMTCVSLGAEVGAASTARCLPPPENLRAEKWSPSTSALARPGRLFIDPPADRLGSFSLSAVDPHSAASKPRDTLMVEVEASASAGANSDVLQSPAVTGDECLPDRPDVDTWLETESHTAKEPSCMPTASCPAIDQQAVVGSNSFCLAEEDLMKSPPSRVMPVHMLRFPLVSPFHSATPEPRSATARFFPERGSKRR